MAVNRDDGKFQACYWLSADRIGNDPDEVEYSDILMELKARVDRVFRQGRLQYAAIFQWNADAQAWDLVEEYEPRKG